MKNLASFLLTILLVVILSFLGIIAINFTGTLTTKQQIFNVLSEAEKQHEIDSLAEWTKYTNDTFTESAIFFMALDRYENKLANIFSSKFSKPLGNDISDNVRFLLKTEGYQSPIIEDPNTRYFYGSRHLFSILANFLGIVQIRDLYFILSVISPLLLWFAFLTKSRFDFILISPIIISMLIGFGLINLGSNIAHAPGFFFPILCLAGVVFYRNKLLDLRKRVFVYAVIASITTYFDTLSGPLPFILSITIIINHMLYHPIKLEEAVDRQWIIEAVGLIGLFISVFAMLVLLKLLTAIPFTNYNVFTTFSQTLSLRLSSVDGGGGAITRAQEWQHLWSVKHLIFYNSGFAATAYFLLSGVAWVLILIVALYHLASRTALACWREIIVLIIASSVIIIWFTIFVNHTYVHAHFMGRIAIIPASAGLMCLIYLGGCLRGAYKIGRALAIAVCPFVCCLVILFNDPLLTISDIIFDHERKIDIVSPSNELSIKPDGIPDIIVKFNLGSLPNISKIRINNSKVNKMTLLRTSTPPGMYSTAQGTFPLAVLDENLRVLNNVDRSIDFSVGNPREFYLAFPADEFENPDSVYQLIIITNYGTIQSSHFTGVVSGISGGRVQ